MRKLLITLIELAICLPAWPGDNRSIITTVVEDVFFPEDVAVTSQEFIFISTFNHGGYIVRGNGQGAATAVVGTGLDTGSIDGEGGDPWDDFGDGGPATQASIRDAFDVAVDEARNIFIADTENHRVRRVDVATGIIETVAGTGVAGSGGDGDSFRLASVANPSGLALGPDGSLYLADRNNHRIRRIELRSDARPFAPIVGLEPGVLWPPNHRLAEVRATASAGVCATGEMVLSSITSSEPDDAPGTGDGATLNDIQSADIGLPDDLLLRRAERGGAAGRTCTMTYELAGSGGQQTAVGTVFVPWSRGASAEPLVLHAESTPAGTLLTWAKVPGAFFYNVARGCLGDVRVSGSAVHLGDLTCAGSGLTTSSTIEREDPEQPALGEAFYYVAEYDNGWPTEYGTAETPLPRLAMGGCP